MLLSVCLQFSSKLATDQFDLAINQAVQNLKGKELRNRGTSSINEAGEIIHTKPKVRLHFMLLVCPVAEIFRVYFDFPNNYFVFQRKLSFNDVPVEGSKKVSEGNLSTCTSQPKRQTSLGPR